MRPVAFPGVWLPSAILALAVLGVLGLSSCGRGGARTDTREARKLGSAAESLARARGLPAPTPGSKAPAPGVPTSRGGDDSIQTWGVEASAATRRGAAEAVRRYLRRRAARRWRDACAMLAAKSRREQRRYDPSGRFCAGAMAYFAADASNADLRNEARIVVLSFRVGRRYSFLIYRRDDGAFAIALDRMDGTWRIVSPIATRLE